MAFQGYLLRPAPKVFQNFLLLRDWKIDLIIDQPDHPITPPNNTQSLPKRLASLLNSNDYQYEKTSNAYNSRTTHERYANRPTSTYNMPLHGNMSNDRSWDYTPDSIAANNQHSQVGENYRFNPSIIESSHVLPREDSAHTDISNDLGDLQIRTNCEGT